MSRPQAQAAASGMSAPDRVGTFQLNTETSAWENAIIQVCKSGAIFLKKKIMGYFCFLSRPDSLDGRDVDRLIGCSLFTNHRPRGCRNSPGKET